MSWNYRILRHEYKHKNGDIEEYLKIHEVYYDENGNPKMCTVEGMSPGGEDLSELKSDLDKMIRALSLPILDYSEIGEKNES